MYSGLGNVIDAWVKTTAILLAVFVPLGLWKAVEVILWLIHHVNIGIAP